jgi:hypothetical protein
MSYDKNSSNKSLNQLLPKNLLNEEESEEDYDINEYNEDEIIDVNNLFYIQIN